MTLAKTRFVSGPVLAALIALLTIAAMMVGVTPASGTACTSPVKYASSSNTLYLVLPQTYTPTQIVQDCAAAPLKLVDPATKTWELSADLILQNGATLDLYGDNAAAGPGDVDTLRIRSLASNAATEVQSITAAYGTINADAVTVTSWDDATNGPDTNRTLPTSAGSTDQGRAFVRAQSSLSASGTPQTSTMNIVNSTFEYLGYYGGESYGVSYKAEGCSHTALSACAALHVGGEEINSQFLNNYMGTYTWGAYGMSFLNDTYSNNIQYGLDTHDVSDYLDIEHDHFSYNGDHGVICSQRCDHLTIEYNESDHNGLVPWAGPDPQDATNGQVHGIMIHRGVTNTVIAYNYVHDEPTGAGIAIFDCVGDSVHDNTVTNAKYGIRLSVGSADNVITNNTFTNSASYGLYTYQGSDLPENSTANGHPTDNVFTNNLFNGSGSNIIKLTQTDGTILTNNTIENGASSIYLYQSKGTVFDSDTLTSGQVFALTGTSGLGSTVIIKAPAVPISVSDDAYSSADITSTSGEVYTPSKTAAKTAISPSGSDLTLTSALVGTKGVTVTPTVYTVVPSTGSGTATASVSGTSVTFTVVATASLGQLSFTVGGRTAGASYKVTRNGTKLTTAVANASGVVTFADPAAPTGTTTYKLSPA